MHLVSIIWLILCIKVVKSTEVINVIEVARFPPGDKFFLDSSKFNYSDPLVPTNVVWKFSQNIEIKVKKFKIDGQIGDFVLICKYPFPKTPKVFPIINILGKLPIGKSILLSWKTEVDKLYRLVNPHGVFVFFHGERGIRQLDDTGFLLEVQGYGKMEEPPSTSEPPATMPPGQNPEDVVSRFVTGKRPNQFLAELDTFKLTLAKMTDKYCEDKGIERPSLTTGSDVDVPLDKLRYCDRSWLKYKTCVEVAFSIVTYDNDGKYVMTKVRIDEMWKEYSGVLNSYGYYAYDPPIPGRLVAWVWIAACLGSILIISVILCIVWLKKAEDELKKDAEISKALTEMTDDDKFYDRENPVHQIRKTMVDGRLERDEQRDEIISGRNFSNTSSPYRYYSTSETYQDNQLYVPDEDEENEEDEDEEYYARQSQPTTIGHDIPTSSKYFYKKNEKLN